MTLKKGDLVKDERGNTWEVDEVHDWWITTIDPITGHDPRDYLPEQLTKL